MLSSRSSRSPRPTTPPARPIDEYFLEHLAGLTDDELASLLARRPDVAVPPPADLAVLATRLSQRPSVHRALVRCTTRQLALLHLLAGTAPWAPAPSGTGVSHIVTALRRTYASPPPREHLLTAVKHDVSELRGAALITGTTSHLRAAPQVDTVLSTLPDSALPCPAPPRDVVDDLISELDRPQRAVMDTLVEAVPPRGESSAAAPDAPDTHPVARLLAHGLLYRLSDTEVQLPGVVARSLRGADEPAGAPTPFPPVVCAEATARHGRPSPTDGGASAAFEMLHSLDVLLTLVAQRPVPLLRTTGDLGKREGARLAAELPAAGPSVEFLLELAAAAGLVAMGRPTTPEWTTRSGLREDFRLTPGRATADTPRDDDHVTLTPVGVRFSSLTAAERWAVLLHAWLGAERDFSPSDAHPLSSDRSWPAGPRVRYRVLRHLWDDIHRPCVEKNAEEKTAPTTTPAVVPPWLEPATQRPGPSFRHPGGLDPREVEAALSWAQPLRRISATAMTTTLTEAAALGLLAEGRPTDPLPVLLGECAPLGEASTGAGSASPGKSSPASGESPLSYEDLVAACSEAIPETTSSLIVQGDNTLVAPGPLTPEVDRLVRSFADIETPGTATVFRVSEDSLRRALSQGHSASALHAFLAASALTPVPQSLTYLIDDMARRHGRLRVGSAQSVIHTDDPTVVSELLRLPTAPELALRPLAPTVVVSPVPLPQVMDALRESGLSPVAEDSAGTAVTVTKVDPQVDVPPALRGLPWISPEHRREAVTSTATAVPGGGLRADNGLRAGGSALRSGAPLTRRPATSVRGARPGLSLSDVVARLRAGEAVRTARSASDSGDAASPGAVVRDAERQSEAAGGRAVSTTEERDPVATAVGRDTLPRLRHAAARGTTVTVGAVNREGVVHSRVVRPLSISGGVLVARDLTNGTVQRFPLHRITSVSRH